MKGDRDPGIVPDFRFESLSEELKELDKCGAPMAGTQRLGELKPVLATLAPRAPDRRGATREDAAARVRGKKLTLDVVTERRPQIRPGHAATSCNRRRSASSRRWALR